MPQYKNCYTFNMDNWISVFSFFWICWNFGQVAVPFEENEDAFEMLAMRIGAGIAVVLTMGIVFNVVKIPLDIRTFFFLATLVFGIRIFIQKKNRESHSRLPAFCWEHLMALALGIGVACVFLYGAFGYSWLEDDDPLGHAAGVQYVAIEKNLNVPQGEFYYINPYPPGYDMLMGILRQNATTISFTLKFFNVLIISLGIIFFYFFSNRFFMCRKKALWATFFLAAIPCYLSHFIWAHALAVSLFPVVFYFLLRSWQDGRFFWATILSVAGVLFTQPDESIKLIVMIMILAWGLRHSANGIFLKTGKIIGVALILGLLWWGGVFVQYANGTAHIAMRQKTRMTGYAREINGTFFHKMFSPSGGIRQEKYRLSDLWSADKINRFDAPTGFGASIFLFAVFGLVLILLRGLVGTSSISGQDRVTLGWFLFTLTGISTALIGSPVGLFPYRFWILLAFPVCLLAAEGALWFQWSRFKGICFAGIILLTVLDAGSIKTLFNILRWSPGDVWDETEFDGYCALKTSVPPNTRVFAFTDNFLVIGHDMRSDFWTKEHKENFYDAILLSDEELYGRLRKFGYHYIVISQRDINRFGKDRILQKTKSMSHCGFFEIVHMVKEKFWVFKVVRS